MTARFSSRGSSLMRSIAATSSSGRHMVRVEPIRRRGPMSRRIHPQLHSQCVVLGMRCRGGSLAYHTSKAPDRYAPAARCAPRSFTRSARSLLVVLVPVDSRRLSTDVRLAVLGSPSPESRSDPMPALPPQSFPRSAQRDMAQSLNNRSIRRSTSSSARPLYVR